MVKKIIGYQITNDDNEIPTRLWDWLIFRDWKSAYEYAKNHEDEMPKGYYVKTIYNGDIEDPSYID